MLGALLLFWVPAWPHGRGFFPAPLDDTYIYFDFARETARGCVLCWTPGGGFSSGATSPPYALLLGLAHALGASGARLGWAAAAIAWVCLVDAARTLTRLVRDRGHDVHTRGATLGATLLAAAFLLGIPRLTWAFASGMETALLSAVLLRATERCVAATRASAPLRDRAQLRAGLWIAALGLTRPECVPLALALALAVAHGAGSRPLLASLARAFGPAVVALVSTTTLQWQLTGETAAAGALRKMIHEDPFASGQDVALMVFLHLARLSIEGIELSLGGAWPARAWLLLGLVAVWDRAYRRPAVALLLGGLSALVLVSLNKTAPFQNLRYVAPTLLMWSAAAAMGAGSLLARRPWRPLGAVLAAVVLLSAATCFPQQIDHFARASKNIRDQQVEVGLRLAAIAPAPKRVFVGDAGAIPYVSGLPALDGLGLGGFGPYPFARASVHGPGAVIELIESMPPQQRPDVLAIYDSWWPGVGEHFGHELFRITLSDNVICGDPTKVVYAADWSLLEDRAELERTALDRLDVADLMDERAHHATFTRPHAGYVHHAVLRDREGVRRFDAVRLLAEGQELSFVPSPRRELPARVRIELTTDSPPGTSFEISWGAHVEQVTLPERRPDTWAHAELELSPKAPHGRVHVRAVTGSLRLGAVRLSGA